MGAKILEVAWRKCDLSYKDGEMFLGHLCLLRRPEGGSRLDKPVQLFLVSAVVVSLLGGSSTLCRPKGLSRLGQEDSVTYQIILGEGLNLQVLEGLASLRMLDA